MESNAVWLPSLFAKQRVPSGMGFDFSILRKITNMLFKYLTLKRLSKIKMIFICFVGYFFVNLIYIYNKQYVMKNKIILSLVFLLGIITYNHAQVSNYTFSQSAGTYSSITGTAVHTASWDNAVTSVTIPFTFYYNSIGYTSCNVSSNGFITFGSTAPAIATYTPISSSESYAGSISACGFDLYSNSTTGGNIIYTTSGSSPNRVFTIQYTNAYRYTVATYGGPLNFQIKLTESTNIITLVYGSCSATNTTNTTVEVGIRGSANTDYNSRTLSVNSAWLNNTGASSSSSGGLRLKTTALPASGTTFIWTPPSPCTAPTTQATSYVNSSSTSTTITSSFTAASPSPSGYLVVRSSGSLNTNPANGTTYSAGGTLGNGTIVQVGSSTSISATSLTANTAYTFTIFSYNTGSCTGPTYYTTSPLVGTTTTCLGTPTSNAGSSILSTSFNANWSSVTGATGYILDVATDNTFTTMVSGYNGLAIGNVTTYSVTGLSSATIYYYRVRATGSACTSTNSSTQTVTTSCGTYPLTYTQLFNASTIPLCWSTSIAAVQTGTKISYVTSSTSTTASPQEGTYFVKYNSFSNTNGGAGSEERLISPSVVTTGTSSVDVEFYWYQDNGSSYNSGSYLSEGVTVQWSTNGTTWTSSTFYPRFVSTALASGEWSKKTLTLPSGAGNIATLYVAFKFHSEYGYNLYLDNVVIKPTPTCSEPTLLTSSSITSIGGTISWTASPSSPSSGYDYYVSTSSTAPISSTTPTGSVSAGVTSVSLSGLSNPTQYYFWVRSNCGSSSYSTWAGSATFTTLLINDNSGGAIDLTINSSTTCTTTTTGTSIGATQTLAAQSGYGTADDDVWYKFTATAVSLDMTVARGTMGDLVVEGYTSSLVSIGVIDGSTTTESVSFTNLTIGNVYYIRVYSYASTLAKQGTFTICMTTPTQPPVNDNASGAITLIVNDPYITGTNDGATSSTTAPTPSGPSYYGGDVWYKVVVPSGGTVQIRTSALVLTDIVVEVYTGTASALTYIIYNDDSSSVNAMPYIELTGRPQGETIWIRVWDYSGDNIGTFKIRATTPISLPIELLSFNGVSKKLYNSLYWSTASESNNDYFTVEKTLDGITYNIVGVINANGNSQVTNNYELKDFSFEKVINYYRLKQTDINGNYTYSDIISIDNRNDLTPTVIKVVNMLGQEVNDYSNGVYMFYYDDGTIVKRYFIK